MAQLARYLVSSGDFTVSVVIPTAGRLSSVLIQSAIPVYIANPETLRPPAGLLAWLHFFISQVDALISIYRLIQKLRPDIVYSNTTRIVVPALAARLAGVPHICHIRELNDQSRFAGVIAALLSRLSIFGIAMSQECKTNFSRYAPRNFRIHVVYDAVDLSELECRRPSPDTLKQRPLVLGMGGWIAERKGQIVFAQVIKELIKRGCNVIGLIAGDVVDPRHTTYKQRLMEYIHTANLDNIVILAGYQDSMGAFLSQLDIFLMPSIRPEGAGMAAVEAMGACLPVIAINIGGVRELIEDGITGYLVPADPAYIADTVELLGRNAELRGRMGAAGRARCNKLFNPSITSAHLVNIIRNYRAIESSG